VSGSDQNDREARLAAKLRENLKRRKDLNRARNQSPSESSNNTDQDTAATSPADRKPD